MGTDGIKKTKGSFTDDMDTKTTNATIELRDDQQKHWVKVVMDG
jgi:hypothetical protein